MKPTPSRTLVYMLFPLLAVLPSAFALRGSNLVYYLAAVGFSILAALVAPHAYQLLGRHLSTHHSLLVGSLVGWLLIGGGLLVMNFLTERAITWGIYPAIGLALWPLGTWLLSRTSSSGS